MFTWYVTFDDQPAVRDLAAKVRERLAGLPGLDLVPGQWLHLTTQGIGFTDEVSEADLAAITGAARARLASVTPPEVTIGPARRPPPRTSVAEPVDRTHWHSVGGSRLRCRTADRLPGAAASRVRRRVVRWDFTCPRRQGGAGCRSG
jgi:hypothetical protein